MQIMTDHEGITFLSDRMHGVFFFKFEVVAKIFP